MPQTLSLSKRQLVSNPYKLILNRGLRDTKDDDVSF